MCKCVCMCVCRRAFLSVPLILFPPSLFPSLSFSVSVGRSLSGWVCVRVCICAGGRLSLLLVRFPPSLSPSLSSMSTSTCNAYIHTTIFMFVFLSALVIPALNLTPLHIAPLHALPPLYISSISLYPFKERAPVFLRRHY